MSQKGAKNRGFGALLLILALVVVILLLIVPRAVDKVVFLDIGQGDSIFVQVGTRQVLIDGGPGQQVLSRLTEEMPWFDQTIEIVMATHPDKDHIEGLVPLLDRYDVEVVVLPYVPHTSFLQEAWLREVIEAVTEKGAVVRFGWAGEKIHVTHDVDFTFLWPTMASTTETKNTNDASLVTRLDFYDTSFLLTGDIEAVAERGVLGSAPTPLLDVDVLKIPHHGSKTSSTAEFIAAVSPVTAIVSAGRGNSYGHPNPEVMKRYDTIRVLRTDEMGSIRFLHKGGQWLLSCSLKSCITSE